MAQSSKFMRLVGYLRPHWKPVSLGLLSLLVVNALGVTIPLIIGYVVDELSVSFTFNRLALYVLLVLVLASVMWVIRMASRIFLFGAGRQVEFDLKQRIFEHLLTLEPAYFGRNTIGDLINRATSDVDNIRRLLGFAVLSMANTLFAYVMIVPTMVSLDGSVALFSLAVYPVMFGVVAVFGNRLRRQQLDVQEEISNLSDLIQEDMGGISLVKIYAQEENERRAFARRNRDLLTANLSLAKTRNTLFPLLGGFASLSLVIALAIGSQAIVSGRLSPGDFVAVILYIQQLVFPTALLGFTITAYQRGEVSLDRIEAIFETHPRIRDASTTIALPQPVGHLRAQGLTFTYPGSKVPALNNINFQIEPGQTVAIVGPIGSGKSTLAMALPRLLEIEPQQLFLDGHDVTQIALNDLRGAIAFVPQDSFLFSTTIQNNVRYGDPVVDAPEVESAAKEAQLHSEILNFPQQYKTIVGERGITLSGGQRQRSALARALLVDAPILVLDDALSSVDNQTATQILANLSNDTRKKTVIFVSHQMSAAAACDRILVMDQGQIVQSGTHDTLVSQPGLYQELWNQHKLKEVLQ
ncbi:ABC transporter ATP-binding protein [cf. Phormidesmis sp. LEGE 11477]|uniref:ABC transporter ATP-binding protein n=1 Tax=cf. Phormidesmis sp. LEGE 11477 TaxID=1828680 RepID=UPI00188302EA|nr:ABC transporter ATP-binding protein [cf. Phormidesmis sp. LEGE 11477]MBE9062672.1 ABC transporter ATP-binding protein [cf. Phormidesmis sp. LEGE 11477]